ncbi:MAG: cytochrome b/b6 domain-containing protein [Woeseiaceae bacterium]
MSSTHYSNTAKLLHWTIAGAIVLQFVLAKLAERADDADLAVRQLALLANHKSVGISILVLAIVRLGWRAMHAPPALPAAMPSWQVRASQFSHWALYALIVVIPITGWLMSSASAYSVSWFNLIQLPDFISPNSELKDIFEEIHETLAKVLFLLALLHILAALKHAIFDKDGVLSRMLSVASLVVFAVVLALGIGVLAQSGKPVASADNVAPLKPAATIEQPSSRLTELPLWQIDFANSFIRFTGDQAGAKFDGEWLSWSAEMRFSSNDLPSGFFDVIVNTAEVNTNDQERDDVLSDPEWFDTRQYPEAYYRAASFSANSDGSYNANGNLVVKGVSAPVVLTFTIEEQDDQRILVGHAEFLRLDLGIGVGEWEDTSWVENEVSVDVRVEASLSR